jgi:hypothetical protein
MLRKILAGLSALVLAAALFAAPIARSANLPYFSGPNCAEASQLQACLNQLIQTLNPGVAGLVLSIPGPTASTATTAEQTFVSAAIPTNTLLQPGQSLRLTCAGNTASNGNTKSAKLYLGAFAVTTGNFTTSAETWKLELLVTLAATPTNSVGVGDGLINTTVVAPTVTNDLTDNFAAALTAKCTGTQGSASASDMTQDVFLIEQVK